MKDSTELGRDNQAKGKAFEERAVELYRILGYRVEQGRNFSSRQIDLFMTKSDGDLEIVRAVECKSGPVTADHFDKFLLKLALVRKEYPSALGTILSDSTYTDSVAEHASRVGVGLLQFSELSAKLLDGKRYASSLKQSIEDNKRYSLDSYIDQQISPGIDEQSRNCFDYINEWVADSEGNQLTLLGDAGTGKTFLTRVLAYRYADAYINDPLTKRLPIHIDLREADRMIKFEGLILTHLAQCGLDGVSFEAFLHSLTSGHILLMLDGFDEMAARVTSSTMAKNFDEITRGAKGKAKIILTSRTEHFRSRTEVEEIVLGGGGSLSDDTARDLYFDIISRKGFSVSYLRPFTIGQIEKYVKRKKGKLWSRSISKIRKTYNLMELSQRPLLLEMIVKTVDKLKEENVNRSTLYEIYTRAWIQRERWRGLLSPAEKLGFVIALARSLWQHSRATIHYKDLVEYIAQSFTKKIRDPQHLAELDLHVRTASFLVRDSIGYYGFAHKSFMEYFYARYLAEQIANGDIGSLNTPRLTLEIVGFLRDLVNRPNLQEMLQAQLTTEYAENISENALIALYGMSRIDRIEEQRSLKGIEMPSDMVLAGSKLDHVTLEGANMVRCNLMGANLEGARLIDCDLTEAKLGDANLREADLTRGNLARAVCVDTDFTGTLLEASHLDGANFQGANFDKSVLLPKSIYKTQFTGCSFISAELSSVVTDALQVADRAFADMTSGAFSAYSPETIKRLQNIAEREAIRQTGDPELAAEILSDIWLALARQRDLELPKNLDAYVRAIVMRLEVNKLRRKRPDVPLEDVIDELAVPPSAIHSLEREELISHFRACVNELSDRSRFVINGISEGKTLSMLAEELKISQSSISRLRNAALVQIRSCLDRKGINP